MNLCRLPLNLPTMLLVEFGAFSLPSHWRLGFTRRHISQLTSLLHLDDGRVKARQWSTHKKSGSQRRRYRQHCQAQRSRKHIDLFRTPSTIVQDLEITQQTIKGKKKLKKKQP